MSSRGGTFRNLSRDPWFIILAIALVLALIGLGIYLATDGQDSESAPAAISQDELVTQYLAEVPDPEAQPADIVDLAATTCGRLDSGVSVADLIRATASVYNDDPPRAKRALRVLVSYGCPKHLDRF